MEPTDTQNQPSLNLPKSTDDNSAMSADGTNPQTATPKIDPAQTPLTVPSKSGQTSNMPGSVKEDTPETAKDTDLIEKEWVDKAKNIVEKTREDPYVQNQKINQMKAEYIKKRYNRDIKLTNE